MQKLSSAPPPTLLADKSNLRGWGLSVRLWALTNRCQDVFKASPPASESWLTAMAPAETMDVVHPDIPFVDPYDPETPRMVEAWGIIDVASQMIVHYRKHCALNVSILRERARRHLRARFNGKTGPEWTALDPLPTSADYNKRHARLVARAAEEDERDRRAGVPVATAIPGIGAEEDIELQLPGRRQASESEDEDDSMSDSELEPMEDADITANPAFEMLQEFPPSTSAGTGVRTRSGAAAAAALQAETVAAAVAAGGGSLSSSVSGAAGARSAGRDSATAQLRIPKPDYSAGPTLLRRPSGVSDHMLDPTEEKNVVYLRMGRPEARVYPVWDLKGFVEAVEDLDLDFMLTGRGRKPRNVDERLFAQAARLALDLHTHGAKPLPRAFASLMASSVLPSSAPVASLATDKWHLSKAEKESWMKGMMLHYMDPVLHREFEGCATPQAIFDALEKGYLYVLMQQIPFMQSQLQNLIMAPGEDMRVYFMRCRELCLKLSEAGVVSGEHQDVMAMLRGVTEEKYRLSLSQLQGTKLEFWPTLEVFTTSTNWMGFFTHTTPSKKPTPGFFAPALPPQVPAGSGGSSRGRGRGSMPGRGRGSSPGHQEGTGALCAHCKRPGHVIDTCWQKYPKLNPRYKVPAAGSAPFVSPSHLALPADLSPRQLAALVATVEGFSRNK
jgi:gag-polypeptide of LTR copia-type